MPEGQIAPDWYNSLPDANISSSAPQQQNDLGYKGNIPAITVRPQDQPVQMNNSTSTPDWYNNLPNANLEQLNSVTKQNNPATILVQNKTWHDNTIGQNIGRAADVARSSVAAGVAAGNPIGMAINSPTLGFNVGAKVIGQPLAYGTNLLMGNPNPWESAKATTNDVTNQFNSTVPNTNDIAKLGARMFNMPLAEPGQVSGMTNAQPLPGEQLSSAIIQGATGAPGLGISAKLGAGLMGADEAIHQSPIGGTYAETPLQFATMIGGARASKAFVPKTQIANPLKPTETFGASEKQLQTATQDLLNRATNSQQAIQNISNQKNGGQLVPGAIPTMGEVAGDVGIANAQKGMQTAYKEPFSIQEQSRQQAFATPIATLTANGNVENLGAYARQVLEDQQNNNMQSLEIAKKEGESKISVAKKEAADSMQKLGNYGDQPDKGATGDIILDAHAVQDKRANDMYKVLDKVNNEDADLVTLRNTAQDVLNKGEQSSNAPPKATVTALVQRILNPNVPDTISSLRGYLSQISAAARSLAPEERGDMSMLMQLREAANKGLENTVNGLALKSEQFYKDMQQHIDATKEQLYGSGQQQIEGGNVSETGMQRPSAKSGKVLSSSSGAKGQASGAPAIVAGDKGVQENPGNFTSSDLIQYKNANKYFLQKSTLQDFARRGIIDSIGTLNSEKFDRWYSNPENRKLLQRNPAFSGQLTKAAGSQKVVENLKQDVQDSIDAMQKQYMVEQQRVNKTAFAKYANENADPVGITSRIFSQGPIAARKQFYQLVQKIKNSPEALQSLRDAVSQHIYNIAKISENQAGEATGISRPDVIKNFVGNHIDSLKIIYGNESAPTVLMKVTDFLNGMKQDIQRRQDYTKMTSGASGSDTAANLAYSQRGFKNTVLGWLARKAASSAPAVGAAAGTHFGHFIGFGHAAGAVVGEALGAQLEKLNHSFSRSGLETIDKIQLAMMRDPTGFGLQMMRRFDGSNPPPKMLLQAAETVAKLGTIQIPQEKKK